MGELYVLHNINVVRKVSPKTIELARKLESLPYAVQDYIRSMIAIAYEQEQENRRLTESGKSVPRKRRQRNPGTDHNVAH